MTATESSVERFIQEREPFLRYLAEGARTRPALSLREIVAAAGGPQKVAISVEDVLNGFCKSGALASPRVGAIIAPITALLTQAHELGVPHVAIDCDTHRADAEEFHQFAPHCVAGTWEAEPVDELKRLPFYDSFAVTRKNSIAGGRGAGSLWHWVHARIAEGVTTVIAVGDCSDLCLYQSALGLKLYANEENRPLRVIVPVNTVQTYDLPLDVAARVGAMPHDGDLLHEVFLYNLALNGIEVVGAIEP